MGHLHDHFGYPARASQAMLRAAVGLAQRAVSAWSARALPDLTDVGRLGMVSGRAGAGQVISGGRCSGQVLMDLLKLAVDGGLAL